MTIAFWLAIINDGVFATFLAALLFPLVGVKVRMGIIRVSGFWPWWQHSWGWNIVCFDEAVAIALLPSWLHHVFGINPETTTFLALDAVAIWSVLGIIAWRTVLIWIAQRRRGSYGRQPDDGRLDPAARSDRGV